MRSALRYSGIALAALLSILTLYEAIALSRAQKRTPGVIEAAKKGEIRLRDVPRQRLNMLLKVEDPNFYNHKGLDFSTPGAGMTSITQSLVKRFLFQEFSEGICQA